MLTVTIGVTQEDKADFVLSVMSTNFDDVHWSIGQIPNVDILFSFGEEVPQYEGDVFNASGLDTEISFVAALNAAIDEGEFFLPTAIGREGLLSLIHKRETKLKEIRDNNPLHLKDHEIIPDQYVDATLELSAHMVHGTVFKRKHPDLEQRLSARAYRTLQRIVPSWGPIAPMFDDPDILSQYPDFPKSGEELAARISLVQDKIKDLGVTPDESVLDYSQLNLGIPFPGGMHRDALNLKDPDDDLQFWMKHAANFMLRGLKRVYKSNPEGFSELNVRVGVKSNNFQGALACTNKHSVRQTLWSIMLQNGCDIFYFSDLLAVAVSGFRTQSNGSGKKRLSYVISALNKIAKTRVIDGEDLTDKKVVKYLSAEASDHKLVQDQGKKGGRKRYVANIESAQNDALLPIPAYIGATKDLAYKTLFQQDTEILSRFVSGSSEFEAFWTEGYNAWPLLRERVHKHFGVSNVSQFIALINELGECIQCGDVQNYDASATFSFVAPFLKELLSDKAYALAHRLYNADKIGVYTDHDGVKRFYYITCNKEDHFPQKYKDLVDKTAEIMSSLPSGLAITAQCGRGPMYAALSHLAERLLIALGEAPASAREIVSWMPDTEDEFSFFFGSAFMNDGGDDHNLGLLIITLLTGIGFDKSVPVLHDLFESYEFLSLLEENPKMNCGFKFHDDANGRCISISLSESRLYANTLYPEYPRSALGLHSSITQYVQSAVGTPLESTMEQLANIIVCDIYRFDSLQHLADLAFAEETHLALEADLLPARQQIALILGVQENDLEWMYTLDELIELGIDEELLNQFRRPIPSELTKDPSNFFNMTNIM